MVEINGEQVDWEEGLTIEKLLKKMNYTYPLIVIKVNGTPVNKEDWPVYQVPDGARVQAHHLIAGG